MRTCLRASGIALLVLLAALVAEAQEIERGSLVQEIGALAAAVVDRGDVVGLSVTVLHRGETLFRGDYGSADLESFAPVTDSTLFYVGSITKLVTAAAITRLAARGAVDLDADVTLHIPELDDGGVPITLRHLMSHTSGLAGPGQVAAKFLDRRHLEFSRAEVLELLQGEPRVAEPGEQYAYNNLGYLALGVVIERVSGASYETFVREEVLAPAGARSTQLCDGRRVILNRASGYLIQAGTVTNHEPVNTSLLFAAGGLCSTSAEIAGWLRALAHGDIVSAVDFERMATPGALSDGSPLVYGYGLFVDSLDVHRRIYHGGDVNGFSSHAAYYPGEDLAVVVQSNTRSPAARRLEHAIASRVLEIPAAPPVTATEGAAFIGTFQCGSLRLSVIAVDGELWLVQGNVQLRILSLGDGAYGVEERPELRLTFVLAEGEAETMVLNQSGQAHEFQREG
jgi:D-alanyl-D-alanine carboxypeptidase